MPGAAAGWPILLRRSAEPDGVATLQKQFNASGLTVDKQTDITSNVLTALRLDTARKLGLIDTLIPRVVHWPFRAFAGIEGTRNYARFESGKALYLSAQLTKTCPVSLPAWRRTGPWHRVDPTIINSTGSKVAG